MKSKSEKIAAELEKLAEEKERLKNKEKLLKVKNRQLRIKRYIEVGSIAAKYQLDFLTDEELNGGFAEMQEKARHSPILEEWMKRAKVFAETNMLRLIISFAKAPSEELKKLLKDKQFRQNAFRKTEWCGLGIKEEIERLAQENNGKVEVAGD